MTYLHKGFELFGEERSTTRQKNDKELKAFVVGFLPIVVELRVSGLRIWVAVIHIVACIWILRKQKIRTKLVIRGSENNAF